MNIASQVGIPVPDGDTGKLARAADAWDRLGTIYQNTNARDKITISATLFDDVTSPDAVHIRDDLRTLSSSIDQLLTSCKQLSESCLAYRDALKELRDEIKGFLEGLVKDLAIDAGITIAAALISFGAGAVAGAKAVDTVRRWAKRIGDGIILWRARKAAQIAGRTQDAKDALAKASKAVRDIFERLRKKGDRPANGPKIGTGVKTVEKRDLVIDRASIEKKYKHASNFGVTEPRGRDGFDKYEAAVRNHVDDPKTMHIDGTYRGDPAILNYNPDTGLVVVQSPKGDFISGWKLSPTQEQYVLNEGKLGGG